MAGFGTPWPHRTFAVNDGYLGDSGRLLRRANRLNVTQSSHPLLSSGPER
jgi:hypothetical protein